ncbi:WD domain-containing protein [Colletotrichum sublineola]|uniref:Putative WD domain-containing protein n=1 Tax=Colletotrichum sublineola TaxID=1173701 RepID=A0A066XUG2_COLSU|nr:WD domain-containing protein [Colletotrichum sublineola]KDN69590.1 putative WD domain-containing protein [Colletotrichum sublineola]
MNPTNYAPSVARRPLRRDHYFAPVTGLSFFNARDRKTYLLAGEDSELKIYDAEGRLRGQLKIFRAQSIHGIHVRASKDGQERRHVLLWGNQAVTVIPASVVEELILADGKADQPSVPLAIVEARAPDWIYDGAISPEEPGRGALVTAHNEILEFSIGDDDRTLEFGRIVSPSRPILYSAKLTWISKNSVLVAGGTVFGEIIVWKCHFSGDTVNAEKKPWSEVFFVFTGHEGSIFGVDISPEIDIGEGGKARLLASCSDDRTIRIWDITMRPEAPRLQYSAFGEARETGFGGAVVTAAAAAADLTAAQVASSAPLAMVMGHISRIWHVRFPQTLDELASHSATTIYSFGEDSTLQTWSLEIDVEQWRRKSLTPAAADDVLVGATITHKETYARHDGKHIWATTLAQAAGGEVVVATGGADSKINLLWDRSRGVRGGMAQVEGLPSELRTLMMPDVTGKLPSRDPNFATPCEAKEMFHRFTFISRAVLLATSTTGRILVGTFGAELTWSEVGTDAETLQALRSCTSVKSPAPGVALLGTASKKVFLYKDSAIRQVGTVPGKIADIFCLGGASTSKLAFLVTILGGEEAMQILTLDLETSTITSMVPVPELDSRFVVTAACQTNGLLILGSRHGYMSVFRRTDGQLDKLAAPDRRTDDAITSIKPLPASSPSSTARHIITTSRDGNYRIYKLSPSASSSPLCLRHETGPAAVPNLEDAWVAGTDLVLCGFHSKNFIVWNETRHEELLRIDCGGAHRAFAYIPQDSSGDCILRFVCKKAATLGVYVQPHASAAPIHHRTLKHGSHGREVRVVAYSGRRYIASGAEDTAIRIWEYAAVPELKSSRRELRCVKVVKVHTAGLQSLKWLGEELLFSCSGNEEFMVWRTSDLGGVAGLGLMREAVFTDRSADGDLRIMSFDVERLGDDGATAITMAFSNSSLKTYRYTPDNGFELLFQGQYTGACLTQARHLRVREGVFDVVTAATDGCLALWRSAGAKYVLQHTARVHQSSIKALDVYTPSAGRAVVLTGGDDNALSITSLGLTADGGDFAPVARAGVRKAHAAAINGLTVLGAKGAGDEVVFATASNDQRVKVWRLGWREGVEEVTLMADEYSGVADAGDIEVIGGGKLVVSGVGLEVWDWSRLNGY